MRYFITGATGFVGGVLARKLHEGGHEVRALVRNPERAGDLKAIGVELFQGDVTDKESMRGGMTGVDGVYHVAGWYKIGAKDKSDGVKVNIQGTRNALELMQELKIPKGVYTSSCVINSDTHGQVVDETHRFHGQHISEYDRTKAIAHEIAREFIAQGLPLVTVMPGVIYGPGDTSTLRDNLLDFLKGRLPALPDKTGYCPAHVEDISDGHILAMERGMIGESYFICGEPITVVEMFKIASQASGRRTPATIPHWIMKVMSVLVGPFDAVLPEIYTSEGLRVVGGVTYWGDNGKAKRELGYNPRPFREGWTETVQHEMSLMGMKQS
jgi:nucleoside-diphosphate-sugar epimerase